MTLQDDNLAEEQQHGSALQEMPGYRLVEWRADHAVVALILERKSSLSGTTRPRGRKCSAFSRALQPGAATTPSSQTKEAEGS